MSMKEIRELAYFCYFDLTKDDIKKLMYAVDCLSYNDPSGIQPSFSSEGGISIPYPMLGLPQDFGEWLHLRFYERLKFGRRSEKTWHMSFVFNIHKGIGSINRNKFAKEKILEGMNKLLAFVEKSTGKQREAHKCY